MIPKRRVQPQVAAHLHAVAYLDSSVVVVVAHFLFAFKVNPPHPPTSLIGCTLRVAPAALWVVSGTS